MGFPDELAAQALATTGGNSTLKATEWILTHELSSIPTNPLPVITSSQQPKLDRFFPSKSSKPSIKKEESPLEDRLREQQESQSLKRKQSSKLPNEPLAERMRPRTINDIVGQDHLLANKSILRSAVDSPAYSSLENRVSEFSQPPSLADCFWSPIEKIDS